MIIYLYIFNKFFTRLAIIYHWTVLKAFTVRDDVFVPAVIITILSMNKHISLIFHDYTHAQWYTYP